MSNVKEIWSNTIGSIHGADVDRKLCFKAACELADYARELEKRLAAKEASVMSNQPQICCPVCQQPLKNPSLEIGQITEIRMTKHRKRILEKLIDAYPRRVERDDIIEAVYFDCSKDGPEWAIHCLYSMVLALNKKLNGYGWQIKGHGKGMGNIPSYQLINISEGVE